MSEDSKKKKNNLLKRVGLFGAGVAGSLAAPAPLAVPAVMAIGHSEKSLSQERVTRLAKQMGIDKEFIPKTYEGSSYGTPHINIDDPKNPKIYVPKGSKESILAHELGHIKNLQTLSKWKSKSKFHKALHSFSTVPRNIATNVKLPFIAGGIAASQEDPSYSIGALNLATQIPTLVDEAAANVHAFKNLSNRYGFSKGLKRAIPLASSFGTYIVPSLAPLAITAYRKRKMKHKTKTSSIMIQRLPGFTDEMRKLATTPLEQAAMIMPGAFAGYYSGKALAGHTAAGTAPHGYKTRSEDIARRAAMVGAPAGVIGGLALSRKLKLPSKVRMALFKKFPKGLIADTATETDLIHAAVPALAAMGGGAAGGIVTGATVGGTARVKNAISGKKKKTAAKKETADEPNLNTFERHPKKILGGIAGGLALGGAAFAGRKGLSKALKKKGPPKQLVDGVFNATKRVKGKGSKWSNLSQEVKSALNTSTKRLTAGPKFKATEEVVIRRPKSSMDELLSEVDNMIGGEAARPVSMSGAPIHREIIMPRAPTIKKHKKGK